MSRAGQFIYLKTRGCLEIDEKTREVRSFVCVNSLVSDDEGRRLIREMKKKFSAIISEAELSALESDIPAVENPQNLERAILNLITNLNNPATYEDDNVSLISDSTFENEDTKRTKSPPLAIIPPKPNTIKPSLSRAAGVIGVPSKGKSPSVKDEPGSPAQKSTCELNIKIEPPNLLSPPSSSLSSIESDMSGTAATTNVMSISHNDTGYNSGNQWAKESLPNISSGSFFSTFTNDLPGGFDDSSHLRSPNEPVPMTSNNNNSQHNRNSVLKRAYASEEDDYSELTKRRTLGSLDEAATSNPILDLPLLSTSAEGEQGF